MIYLLDILYKHQKYLIGLAIFLALSAVSITYSDGETRLNLSHYPLLMICLVLLSILLVIIYIKIDQTKVAKLLEDIRLTTSTENKSFEKRLSQLTSRQHEVYQLIAAGKSNKEIMAELYIEQSTLKTHVNHIYKKLDIKDRKELKWKANQ